MRSPLAVAEAGDFLRGAFLDGNIRAAGDVPVDGGERAGDVERDVVAARQHCHHVGADLVGHVAVGRHPVGADDDCVDLAVRHQVAGHVVGDQGDGDAFLHHLPGGETRPLQERARLVGDDRDFFSGFNCRTDYAQRRAPSCCGQGSGIAVGEHARAVGKQCRARCAHGAVDADVFGMDFMGLVQ